ncbi:TPA: nucleoside triphosphate pyrophosphohydrolase family protein [Vibrio parahaemolyticus]|uniref:nucleoside triphosphate pyrophosphohydrolase family protein n=1 Tax=Vibrio parahaemolyticus TaxID=670 RepID=UPI001EEC95C7|nr:nucleoside triphosphate pyrophosphohydrolase family protein [Vibrio parahaemolyticus]MCG6465386.1 nucleoside triphosphate pyrophosphohydrolase family protein [Vibrio parahaemolyticus]MCG6492097.1 nucleoside triphosphate pyrophosphohydrolase family protein [Vibrio parahaemolyticus]
MCDHYTLPLPFDEYHEQASEALANKKQPKGMKDMTTKQTKTRKAPVRLNNKQREALVRLARSGADMDYLTDFFNVSEGMVYKVLREYREPLTLDAYQAKARQFAVYKDPNYAVLALGEEAGELQGKFAKAIRKGVKPKREDIVAELGDVLWNIANIATDNNISLDEIAEYNLNKLEGRSKRGTIVGEGDHR